MLSKLLRDITIRIGWQTKRKIVVFESDDWGSERFNSKESRTYFQKNGYPVEKCGFSMYDCFESEKDLQRLCEVLSGIKDKKGNSPTFSLLFNPANPDYEKIARADFSAYFYEPFTSTAKRYTGSSNILHEYKAAIDKKLLIPEFHGREHLYPLRWLRKLQEGTSVEHLAFKHRFFGFSPLYYPALSKSYRPAFDLDKKEDLNFQEVAIREGIQLIKETLDYKPNYFVAPDGPFNNSLEKVLHEEGIKYIGTSRMQQEPRGNGKTKRKWHYLGQSNKHGQLYITRSAYFEPINPQRAVDHCMGQISQAFNAQLPAVISTHRANYVGGIEESNRDNGLQNLDLLLKSILKKWPEAEFMSSSELGNLISAKK